MTDEFADRLEALLAARPPGRVSLEDTRDAAVLVPVVAVPEPTLLFTRRTDMLPSHKGQISFPGGSIDPGDASPVDAALREAEEEIALDPAAVRVLGELDAMPTFVTHFVIHPVVGWLASEPSLEPNPHEVAEILHVPVTDFVEDARVAPGRAIDGRTYPTEAWSFHGHVIWGVTARLVRMFFAQLADAGLVPPLAEEPDWPGIPDHLRL